MEKIISQLKLVREMLKKTPNDAVPVPPALPATKEAREVHKNIVADMFSDVKKHMDAGQHDETQAAIGKLKNFAVTAPKGSIDIGHFGKLSDPLLTKDGHHMIDTTDIINHHLGDAKSLKDIYLNHGGEDTIKHLMRSMGANGETAQYSNFHFKKPGLHEDLLDMVNPGKAALDRENNRHLGVLPSKYMGNTEPLDHLDQEVTKAHNGFFDTIFKGEDPTHEQEEALTNAVVARGIDTFKRHHGLT